MTKELKFLLVPLAIMVIVLTTSHLYVWSRLIRNTAMPEFWASVAAGILATGCVLVPLGLLLGRRVSMASMLKASVLTVSYTWLAFFFFVFSLTVISDVLAMLPLHMLSPCWYRDASSRLLFERFLRGATIIIALTMLVLGRRAALAGPHIKHVSVALQKWPQSLNGFRIVQISDLHVATLLKRDYVDDVVNTTQSVASDLTVLTGDLMDGSVDELKGDIAPLKNLKARFGVFMVTGNHEYYSGVNAWIAHLETLGIRCLRNARVAIGDATRGQDAFDLAGIDDYTAQAFGHGHGADLRRALMGRDPNKALVLLAHQPRMVQEANTHGVDLMLSGHTHGGQMWPFGYLVRVVQPFLKGLHTFGTTQIYVSCGTGYWGPPVRFLAPPEITVLTLTRAQAQPLPS